MTIVKNLVFYFALLLLVFGIVVLLGEAVFAVIGPIAYQQYWIGVVSLLCGGFVMWLNRQSRNPKGSTYLLSEEEVEEARND